MAQQVLYINENYLKLNTNLSSNIDANLIRPTMIKAQDIYISSFLGTDLDTLLKAHIIANSLTTLEQDLLVIIKKAQVEFTAYLTYVDILFRWMNKSATSPGIENGTVINRSDLVYVRDIAKNQGEFYLQQAKDFLILNKATFTTFKCDTRSYSFPFDLDDNQKENLYPNTSGYNFR